MYMSITKKHKKIVVFDMDETLGCFVQLGMFTDILEHNIKRKLTNEEFNILMDLFPLYQRPNILSILNYIKQQKTSVLHTFSDFTALRPNLSFSSMNQLFSSFSWELLVRCARKNP